MRAPALVILALAALGLGSAQAQTGFSPRELAQVAELDSAVEVAFDAPRQERWLAAVVPGEGALTVAAPAGLQVRIFGAADTPLATGRRARVAGPGVVYAALVAAAPARAQVTLRFSSVDQLEPNDTPATAAALPLGAWRRVVLGEDADYLRVEAPARGYLHLDARAPRGLRPTAQAVRAGELDPHRVSGAFGLPVAAGTHLLKLGEWKGRTSPRPVYVRVRFAPERDAFAVGPDGALPKVTFDRVYRTSLMRHDEVDGFRVEIPRLGYLRIHTQTLHKKWNLRLRRSYQLAKAGSAQVSNQPRQRLTPGEWSFRLQHTNPRSRPNDHNPAWFGVWLEFIPEADPREPRNDLPANPEPLPLNRSVEACLQHPLDVDWYRVEVPAAGTLQVVAWAPARKTWKSSLAPARSVVLYDATGKTRLANLKQSQGRPAPFMPAKLPARAVAVKPGTYLLRVALPSPPVWEPPFAPFRLEANFAPDGVAGKLQVSGGLTPVHVALAPDAKTGLELRAAAGGGYFPAKDLTSLPAVVSSAVVAAREAAVAERRTRLEARAAARRAATSASAAPTTSEATTTSAGPVGSTPAEAAPASASRRAGQLAGALLLLAALLALGRWVTRSRGQASGG